MNYTVEDLAKNMAMIEFHFGSSSITNIEEVVAYDFDNLLGLCEISNLPESRSCLLSFNYNMSLLFYLAGHC